MSLGGDPGGTLCSARSRDDTHTKIREEAILPQSSVNAARMWPAFKTLSLSLYSCHAAAVELTNLFILPFYYYFFKFVYTEMLVTKMLQGGLPLCDNWSAA
jgi:hypothetical protein